MSSASASSRAARRRELEELLARPSTDFKTWFIPEPPIECGARAAAPDPKTGIRLHGPCQSDDGATLRQVRVGMIGTGETIQAAEHWLDRCRDPIAAKGAEDHDPFLFPAFPGMTAADGFNCDLEWSATLTEKLTPVEVARCTKAPNRDKAVDAMGVLIRERLDALKDREMPPDVVLVALPDDVQKAAGAGRRFVRRTRRRASRAQQAVQLSLFDDPPEEPALPRTLHRVLKGEGMRFGFPTQLAWPHTFNGGEGAQDDATRAWNFCMALYYKAKGMPWRVSGLARGTCYVGVSFFRPIQEPTELQTSIAQAFSERGEGMVLRGASFPWDMRQGPPRLPQGAATELLAMVLEQYRKHHGNLPTRVVVHKSSAFYDEEIAGFEEALGSVVPYSDFLSLAKSNIRFLRVGYEPPLRGTAIQIASRRYIVFTRGYVPYLRLYPGARIPRPLDIHHAHGSAPVTEVLREIFALTRMNWNSGDFASAEPITLAFARRIGLILSELPPDVQPERSFRFYM